MEKMKNIGRQSLVIAAIGSMLMFGGVIGGVPASAAPAKLGLGSLNSEVNLVMSRASISEKAKHLEGGTRAARQSLKVSDLLRQFAPLGIRYSVVGPVTVSGNRMKAYLKLTSPVTQPAKMPLTWVNQGGVWKLSNKSVCDVGSYAAIPCSL